MQLYAHIFVKEWKLLDNLKKKNMKNHKYPILIFILKNNLF